MESITNFVRLPVSLTPLYVCRWENSYLERCDVVEGLLICLEGTFGFLLGVIMVLKSSEVCSFLGVRRRQWILHTWIRSWSCSVSEFYSTLYELRVWIHRSYNVTIDGYVGGGEVSALFNLSLKSVTA